MSAVSVSMVCKVAAVRRAAVPKQAVPIQAVPKLEVFLKMAAGCATRTGSKAVIKLVRFPISEDLEQADFQEEA